MEEEMIFPESAVGSSEVQEQGSLILPSVERLRIILMFLMCINLLGFPTAYGRVVQVIFNFVPIAFFILSGFLVLKDDADRSARIVRSIKRAAIVFAVLTVVYFVINLFFYRGLGTSIFPALTNKRLWFNFLVLNVWPFDIGGAIWYVQALLYAYIIIYFLDKLKLLRFDWLISLVLILFTVVTGELCGVLPWNIAGYTYIPSNFLTRALPYILLGCCIARNIDVLRNVFRGVYWGGIVVGLGLAVGEILLFSYLKTPGYYGHMIGLPITAVSMCMLAFQDDFPEPMFERVLNGSRWYANVIYYLCQPVSVGLVWLFTSISPKLLARTSDWIGIITFAVCFAGVCFAALIERWAHTEVVVIDD